jgi:hypothetical protein
MTRDEGVAHIKLQMAFRTTLDSTIVSMMQLAQTNLEAMPTKPFFLTSEDSVINTTPTEQRIPLPADFLQEIDEAVLRYVPLVPTETNPEKDLIKDDFDVLRKNFFDPQTGTLLTGSPEAYAILGPYFRIFPTPDAVYPIKMPYYKRDTSLSTNVENGWLKHVPFLLLGAAGKLIAKGPVRDQVADGVFTEWVATGTALLNNLTEARMASNRTYQMGGPHQ